MDATKPEIFSIPLVLLPCQNLVPALPTMQLTLTHPFTAITRHNFLFNGATQGIFHTPYLCLMSLKLRLSVQHFREDNVTWYKHYMLCATLEVHFNNLYDLFIEWFLEDIYEHLYC